MITGESEILKDKQYYKFCLYGFLKNLRFFEPFFVIFFLSKELSFLQIGVLYSAREIAINIFEIPSGILADAIGRRRTLAGSFVAYILAFILFFFYSDFYFFLLAMLFYALGDAIRSGINKAMIVDYLKQTGQSALKVEYYGHTRSWSQIGSAVSSLMGGIFLFYNKNLDAIFLFSIVPYLLDFVNVLTYPKFLDNTRTRQNSVKTNLQLITKSFLSAFHNRRLWKSLLNSSVYSGYYKAVKDFIQPFLKALIISFPFFLYLEKEERTALFLGFVYFLIFVANSFVSKNASKLEKLFSSQNSFLNNTLVIGFGAGLLGGFSMVLTNSIITVILFIILLSIENARKPSGVANITENSNSNIHAGILSVQSQLSSLFAASIIMLIGYIADFRGIGTGIFLGSLGLLLLFPLIKLTPKE